MYKSLSLLKFDDIYKYFLLKFLHLSIYKNTEIFNKYNLLPLLTHSYGTRGTRINFPSVPVEVERQFELFQNCKFFNEILSDLLEPQSNCSLKSKYKRSILSCSVVCLQTFHLAYSIQLSSLLTVFPVIFSRVVDLAATCWGYFGVFLYPLVPLPILLLYMLGCWFQ